MAISFVEDLTVDANVSIDKDGLRMDRIFCVSGLTPGRTALAQAATAQDAATNHRIPIYGEQHPDFTNIYCKLIRAVPWAKNGRVSSKVICTYDSQVWSGLPGVNGTQIRISATTAQVKANHDEQGNFFFVTYTNPAGKVARNYVELDVPIAQVVLEFQRIETGSPLLKSLLYTSAINSDSQFQGYGGPLQWMCRSITGNSLGSNKYDVTYAFEFNPMGWAQFRIYEDPINHFIPPPAANAININQVNNGQVANGVFQYTPRQKIFATLGLPNAF